MENIGLSVIIFVEYKKRRVLLAKHHFGSAVTNPIHIQIYQTKLCNDKKIFLYNPCLSILARYNKFCLTLIVGFSILAKNFLVNLKGHSRTEKFYETYSGKNLIKCHLKPCCIGIR